MATAYLNTILAPYDDIIRYWANYWTRNPITLFWRNRPYVIKPNPKYRINPNYIKAIILWEHRGRPKVNQKTWDGKDYSYGLMQVYRLPAIKFYGFKGNADKLLNPNINIMFGVKNFATQLQIYKGDVQAAVMAYNTGTGRETKKGRKYYYGWKKYYAQLSKLNRRKKYGG